MYAYVINDLTPKEGSILHSRKERQLKIDLGKKEERNFSFFATSILSHK